MSPTLLLHFPGGHLLLDLATGALGASWGGTIFWGAEPLPLPVRAVRTDADVGYLHMWSGVTDVSTPAVDARGGVVCWLVDGEEQPVRVAVVPGGRPQCSWP